MSSVPPGGMVEIDEPMKQRLLDLGVSTLHGVPFHLPIDTVFEPPCSIKWMRAEYSLRIGAFSYAVSGYYFGVKIGRYVSIGEDVQIGRGSHPVGWASTSPAFYQHHRALLDFDVPQAAQHEVNAPFIHPCETIIGNDVYIGHGAFLRSGIHVGDGAVIGAQAVVTKDVPPYAIVAGNPAVIRRFRFSQTVIDRLVKLEWWQYPFWDLSGAPVSNPEPFADFVQKRIDAGMLAYEPALLRLASILDLWRDTR